MKHVLFRTLPGRAIVIGTAVKIAVFAQGLVVANRRLLWRVRRKLIISYIFIGFIPSLLIVAFFLLGGLFLFSNFSSYLVQNQFRALGDRAISAATAIAL